MARLAFDIDGVVAEFEEEDEFDPVSFNQQLLAAAPVEGCRDALLWLRREHTIFLVSGRSTLHGVNTLRWLARHRIPYDKIYLNHYNDLLLNPEYKAEIVEKNRVNVFFDDREDIVDHINAHTNCRAHIFKSWNEVVKQVVEG